MNQADRIRELESQIQQLKYQQANCSHAWGETVYDPEKGFEPYHTGEYECHGIHHDPVIRYMDKLIPRWKRTCKKCGLEQFTKKEKTKTELVNYGPDFGN